MDTKDDTHWLTLHDLQVHVWQLGTCKVCWPDARYFSRGEEPPEWLSDPDADGPQPPRAA